MRFPGVFLSVFSIVHPKQKQQSRNAQQHNPSIYGADVPLEHYNQRNAHRKKPRH